MRAAGLLSWLSQRQPSRLHGPAQPSRGDNQRATDLKRERRENGGRKELSDRANNKRCRMVVGLRLSTPTKKEEIALLIC